MILINLLLSSQFIIQEQSVLSIEFFGYQTKTVARRRRGGLNNLSLIFFQMIFLSFY